VIDLLSRASALDPNYFEALLELARAYLEAERPVDAEPVFRQTLALQPDNLDCLVGLAETLILLERFDEARSLLEAPARERRLTPHALMELGRCRDEDGDPDLALASYRAAVSGDQALFSDAIERFIQMGRGAPWRHPARLSEVLALARAALV
ncbi:MAG: tetratricopeptide repeat protein, partial [Rhodospirillaceae bacterium]